MAAALIAMAPIQLHLIVNVITGALVYTGAMVIFRVVPPDIAPYLHRVTLIAKKLRNNRQKV